MKIKVILKPNNKSIKIPKGFSLQQALLNEKLPINNECGSIGKCGKCKVKILKGIPLPTTTEKKLLSSTELKEGIRLACQIKILQEMKLKILDHSSILNPRILKASQQKKIILEPDIKKIYVELSPQSLINQISVVDNLTQHLKGYFSVKELKLLKKLPSILKKADNKLTLIIRENEIFDIEVKNTTTENYGIAFDLGTTTVVGTILNLSTACEIACETTMNPQIKYGTDVISRINYTINNKKGLSILHQELVKELNKMILKMVYKSKIKHSQIYEAVVVGNPTIQHLFLKFSPESLASSPYIPIISSFFKIKAKELNLKINENAYVYTLPNLGGFVGSDTVGMILSSGFLDEKEIKLGIDIGTNGEVILGSKEKLFVCSTAAGSAFEGAKITYGTRSIPGAIEKVVFKDDVVIEVIDHKIPKGICGSGLIDLLAELVRTGILDKNGKIKTKEELKGKIEPKLLKRIYDDGFWLTDKIKISQQDIRELQLAKAAIAAGIDILMKEAKIEKEKIKEVLLAGAFGNFLRKESALRIGLIPAFPLEKIKFVGNAAHQGAKMTLVSKKIRAKAKEVSLKVQYIELCTKKDFQDAFITSLYF